MPHLRMEFEIPVSKITGGPKYPRLQLCPGYKMTVYDIRDRNSSSPRYLTSAEKFGTNVTDFYVMWCSECPIPKRLTINDIEPHSICEQSSKSSAINKIIFKSIPFSSPTSVYNM